MFLCTRPRSSGRAWAPLREGQKLSFDIVTERGKNAAANLKEV
jgi:cold shock CspA family protein